MQMLMWMPALVGGVLCGVAAVGYMLTHGRVAGTSGCYGLRCTVEMRSMHA